MAGYRTEAGVEAAVECRPVAVVGYRPEAEHRPEFGHGAVHTPGHNPSDGMVFGCDLMAALEVGVAALEVGVAACAGELELSCSWPGWPWRLRRTLW